MERLFRENHQELYPASHHHISGEWECQGGLRDRDKLKKQQPDPFSAISSPEVAPALSHCCPHLYVEKVTDWWAAGSLKHRWVVFSGDEAEGAWAAAEASSESLCKGHFPASWILCLSLPQPDNWWDSIFCIPWSNKQHIHLQDCRDQRDSSLPDKCCFFVFQEHIALQELSRKRERGREIFSNKCSYFKLNQKEHYITLNNLKASVVQKINRIFFFSSCEEGIRWSNWGIEFSNQFFRMIRIFLLRI